MANKPTKRQRKFQASGGIKKRIEKGIQFGGNKRSRRKPQESKKQATTVADDTIHQNNPDADNFTGESNLGDLDVESFFATFESDRIDDVEQEQDAHHDDDATEKPSSNEGRGDSENNGAESSSSPTASEQSTDSDTSDDEDEDPTVSLARMKGQMASLAKDDPEFHKYLQENEKSLLEFGNEEEDGDSDSDEDMDEMQVDDEHDDMDEDTRNENDSIELTPELLKSLAKGAFRNHGIKSLRRLIAAYRSACYLSQTTDDGARGQQRYTIASSKVFNDLMVVCLKRCHNEFAFHLLKEQENMKKLGPADAQVDSESKEDVPESRKPKLKDENVPLNPRSLEQVDRWDNLRPIILSFFRSTLQVMSEAKDSSLLGFLLQALSKYLRFLSPFPRVAEGYLKSLTGLWAAPLDSSEDYQVVRLNAFLRIRQLALTQPFPFIEECLKKPYLAYAKRAKFGSSNSPALATLTFMGNCVVELYSLDYHASYQHAFVYIRQLALLLRTALQKKTPEAFQQIQCWQFIQCCKLWVAVLSSVSYEDASGDAAMMRSLIYPLTEVIMATTRSSPSVRLLPLRFHCIHLLQQLAASTKTFIPTTPLLLSCLEWNEWTLAPKKSSSLHRTSTPPRRLEMKALLQFGREDPLRSREQLEAAMQEWFLLLELEIDLYRYSAGFYEFAAVIAMRLRAFLKRTRNGRWKAMGRAILEQCTTYGTTCVGRRAKLAQAPKDVKVLECCKQKTEPSMQERYKKLLESKRSVAGVKEVGAAEGATKDPVARERQEGKFDGEETKTTTSKKTKTHPIKEKPRPTAISESDILDDADEVVEGVDWSDNEST